MGLSISKIVTKHVFRGVSIKSVYGNVVVRFHGIAVILLLSRTGLGKLTYSFLLQLHRQAAIYPCSGRGVKLTSKSFVL